jgi:hypothetical protein
MKNIMIKILFAAILLGVFGVTAFAQSTHNIRSTVGLAVKDFQTGCNYGSFSIFRASTSWTEPSSVPAAGSFRGLTKTIASGACVANRYEFVLLKTGTTTADEITGVWDVIRNGVTVCSACNGHAYGLSAPAGNYYKVYIDEAATPLTTEDWLFSGFILNRFDF